MDNLINIEGLVDDGVLKELSLNKCKIHTLDGYISLSSNKLLKDIYQITLKTTIKDKRTINFKDDLLSILKVFTNLEILAIDNENNVSYIKKDLIFSTTLSIDVNSDSEINIYIIDAYFEITDIFTIQYSLIYAFEFIEKSFKYEAEIQSSNEPLDLVDIKREFP